MNTTSLLLVRSSHERVDSCKCDAGVAGHPSQLSCPWCGCGWLFCCALCGGSFLRARAQRVSHSLEAMAWDYLQIWWGEYTHPRLQALDIVEWTEVVRRLCGDLEEGREYVYLDGFALPTDAGGIDLVGWHSQHDLDRLPHLEHDETWRKTLENPRWWLPDLRKLEGRQLGLRTHDRGGRVSLGWDRGRSGPRYPSWVSVWNG